MPHFRSGSGIGTIRDAVASSDIESPPGRVRIGKLLQVLLEESGLSIREFARRYAGADATQQQVENARRQIIRWIDGTNEPNEKNTRRIAATFGINPDDLLEKRPPTKAKGPNAIVEATLRLSGLLGQVERLLEDAIGSGDELSVRRRLEALEGEVAGLRRNVQKLTKAVDGAVATLEQLAARLPAPAETPPARRAKGQR